MSRTRYIRPKLTDYQASSLCQLAGDAEASETFFDEPGRASAAERAIDKVYAALGVEAEALDDDDPGPGFIAHHRMAGSSTVWFGPFASFDEAKRWNAAHPEVSGLFHPFTDPDSDPEGWWYP